MRARLGFDRASGVLAEGSSRKGRAVVARAATADVVDGTVLHVAVAGALALELLVEGEGQFLRSQVDVPGAATAATELGGGLRQAMLEVRGGARGGAAVGGLGSFEGVAGAATAGVDVVAGSGVRLGDGVGGHLSGGYEGLVVVKVVVVFLRFEVEVDLKLLVVVVVVVVVVMWIRWW